MVKPSDATETDLPPFRSPCQDLSSVSPPTLSNTTSTLWTKSSKFDFL